MRARSKRCKIGIERSLPPVPNVSAGQTGDLFASAPQTTPRAQERNKSAPLPPSRSPPRGQKPRASRRSTAPTTNASARLARLKEWVARAHDLGVVAVDTETTSLDPMQAGLCGFSLAVAPNEPATCRSVTKKNGGGEGLFDAGSNADQIAEAEALDALKPLLEDKSVLKVAQNMKYDWLVFAQRGIEIAGLRRHHADLLRARRRQRRPRHGRSRQALARP